MSEYIERDETVKCRECGSRDLSQDETRGELSCLSCGLVLEENIVDQGQEWRSFADSEGGKNDPARTGAAMNIMMHDKGLSTEIDWQNRDWSGKPVKTSSQMYRMRKWQKRARVNNSRERNLAQALAEMDKMGMHLDAPKSVRQEAAAIYIKTLDAGLIRGRSITGAVASCLYIACQVCGIPRTLDEVAQRLRLGRKEIGRTVRTIKRKLRMKPVHAKASDYIERFCSELGLPVKANALCYEWLEEVKEKELDSGRGPVGIAAALIYMASIVVGHNRTQREIADATNVTEVTIRNRYKELSKALNVEMNT